MSGYSFLLPFPIHPYSRFQFELTRSSFSIINYLFAQQPPFFASQLPIPSVGPVRIVLQNTIFFSWFFVSFFVVFFRAFFSRLVEVLLRWGFGIYQYYVSYWNNGGLYQKNELFCMKILAKPYFPFPPPL